jgi:hypothetical protein
VVLCRFRFFDEKWNDILDVSTFDLPDDGDDDRVGLMCMAVAKNFTQGYTGDNEVFVFAAKGVPWESVETSGPHGGTAHGLAGGFGNSFHADPSDGFRILPEFVFS